MLIRPLLLLTAAAAAWCADAPAGDGRPCERLTLRDGRSLIGYYDGDADQLTLAGEAKATMHVDHRDIVARDPAEPPKPKAKPEPKAPPAAAAEPVADGGEHHAIIERMQAARDAVVRAESESRRANDALAIAERELLTEFERSIDYTPVPIHVPDNPSRDALAQAEEVRAFNERLGNMKTSRSSNADLGFMRQYARMKNVRWLLDALASR